MSLSIEESDLQRGVVIVKHFEDEDRSFSKLPLRKLRA